MTAPPVPPPDSLPAPIPDSSQNSQSVSIPNSPPVSPTDVPPDSSLPDSPAAANGGGIAVPELVETVELRDITIKVPKVVPDEAVKLAFQAGQMTVEAVQQSVVVFFFPQVAKDDKGNARRMLGHALMPIINQSDILRILKLMEVTSHSNESVMTAMHSGQPGAGVIAAANAETVKDNAARDLTAKAEGKPGGIIVPVG